MSFKFSYCEKLGDNTFCELELWHKEKDIFFIDKSDSMGSNDITDKTPSNKKLYKNEEFGGRLGCVVGVINN